MTFVTVLAVVLATGGVQPPDAGELSTPRGAARSYLTALLAGDAEGALAMVAPCSEDARKAVAGSAAIYGALRRLDRSLSVALDAGAEPSDRLALQLQRVDTAWLVVAGDRAVLRFAVGEPMVLRRTEAGWRIWPKERAPGEPSGDELFRLGRAFAGAAREVADGLAGGGVARLLEGVKRASASAVDRAIVAL
ncbi:MAG: hypothetical protein QM704_21870 [Anaeromyxobacteraceae bacterium]